MLWVSVGVGADIHGTVGDTVVVDFVEVQRPTDGIDVVGNVAGSVPVRSGAELRTALPGRADLLALYVLQPRTVNGLRGADTAVVDGEEVVTTHQWPQTTE